MPRTNQAIDDERRPVVRIRRERVERLVERVDEHDARADREDEVQDQLNSLPALAPVVDNDADVCDDVDEDHGDHEHVADGQDERFAGRATAARTRPSTIDRTNCAVTAVVGVLRVGWTLRERRRQHAASAHAEPHARGDVLAGEARADHRREHRQQGEPPQAPPHAVRDHERRQLLGRRAACSGR